MAMLWAIYSLHFMGQMTTQQTLIANILSLHRVPTGMVNFFVSYIECEPAFYFDQKFSAKKDSVLTLSTNLKFMLRDSY